MNARAASAGASLVNKVLRNMFSSLFSTRYFRQTPRMRILFPIPRRISKKTWLLIDVFAIHDIASPSP
jgi:hypothetical protein